MNDPLSLPRLMGPGLQEALAAMPAAVVTGARQTGKSTLVRELADREYVTLDDLDTLERARTQPRALLAGSRPLTLDEVQRCPELLLEVKQSIDARRSRGRFLLTGSANLLLLGAVAESLAGRAAWLRLWPMTRGEQLGLGTAGPWTALFEAEEATWPDILSEGGPKDDWRRLASIGGYPEPAVHLATDREREIWFGGYVHSWLERDIRDLANISSLVDFRRLAQAACLRAGSLLNQTDLARDVGLSQPTAHRWLGLLEASCHLVRLPAFAVNRTKRLIKAPKIYWSDVGLALHLSGDEPRGAHLENLLLLDLLAWAGSAAPAPEITHWRTASGEEVDFVVTWKRRHLPVEIKATRKPTLDDARGLRAFLGEHGKAARAGLLLHDGEQVTWLADRVLAVPWWRVA